MAGNCQPQLQLQDCRISAAALQRRFANAWCAWHLVRGVAAQGDEIRNLYWIDAISRPNLVWTCARHLARADGVEDDGAIGGKLKCVAVAARDEDGAPSPFFFCGSGGEKIVCLEAWRFRILKAAGSDKFRQDLKLLDQSVVAGLKTAPLLLVLPN